MTTNDPHERPSQGKPEREPPGQGADPVWGSAPAPSWGPNPPADPGGTPPPAWGRGGQPPAWGQTGAQPPILGRPEYLPPSPPYPPRPSMSVGTNGMSIASLVLGLLWIYGLGSILAVVFGIVGLRQIKERGQSGGGMAIAGIILGGVFGILTLIIFVIAAAASGPTYSY